jgi:hypothetical protein
LNDLLGSLGADPDQIEKAIDRGFKQVPGVLTNALAGIGVIVDAQTFAQNLNMDGLIQPLNDLAGRLGDEQKAANDAIMAEITTRASQLFDALTASQTSLNTELGLATTAVADFKDGLLKEVEEDKKNTEPASEPEPAPPRPETDREIRARGGDPTLNDSNAPIQKGRTGMGIGGGMLRPSLNPNKGGFLPRRWRSSGTRKQGHCSYYGNSGRICSHKGNN